MTTVTPCDRGSQKAKTQEILFYNGYTPLPLATDVVQGSNKVNAYCYILFLRRDGPEGPRKMYLWEKVLKQ